MKNALLCLFLLLITISTQAQTSYLDELPLPVLRQKLSTSINDTNKVQLQLAIGHLMIYKPTKGKKDIDSAINFAAQAATLSRKLNYHFGIINSMLLSAETFYERNDRETGLKTAENALAFSQKNRNSDGQARSYHLIAQYYPVTDPVSLSNRIYYINKAIAIFRKNSNALWLSFLLTANADLLFQADRTTEGLKLLFEALNLGKGVSRRTVEGIYWHIGRRSYELNDYPNALKYNLLALKTAREVRDTTLQFCGINHSIALTYSKMQSYARAIPYSTEALRVAKRYNNRNYINVASSALATEYTHTNNLSKALNILNDMKSRAYSDLDRLSVNVDFLNNLAYAKRFAKADEYAREVKELLAGIPPHNVTDIMNAYNSLANYYSETNQAKQAYHYTDLYAAMAHKLNYISGIRTAENRYYKLVVLKGDMKSAIGHYLKGQEIKDSIENIAKTYQISLLNIENETQEKSRHIDLLTRKAQINDIKLKRNQLIQKVTIAGSVMLLIITVLSYSRYRLKQRSNALLTLQKLEIDQKNTALQQLVKDKNELLEDKDELLVEKDLLLKEVNHRVRNNLQIVMNLLQSQSVYTYNKRAQQAIIESQNRVQSIALIHDQLYRTDHIAEINLSIYINELIDSLNSSLNRATNKILIDCDIDDISLDVSQAIPVGIILNETVTNALKYAFPNNRTGNIKIIIKQKDQYIEMQISDDGIGLPNDFDLTRTNTLGLTLLKGLTAQLKGTFTIKNNNGLAITLKFPVEVAATQAQLLNN
ncbi:sensor histidine kinase [Mucilaginibacter sp. UR6-1]|uniref:sensor histidine kinase n=1 Tax=Mucilaginibacter sp. UR6-1 TaxID=1435643 RepID=UPI001E5B6775|nr:sensor histidine kinase [Mucilaginibacter sp. UR6-1]MCC8408547.1 sensor histidine kinase [Mucilaginibacter sp. UR6-1]